MLSQREIDVLIEKFDAIKSKEFKKIFRDVVAAEKQEKVIEDFIRHYYEEIIRTRPCLPEPKPEDLVEFFKQFADEDSN